MKWSKTIDTGPAEEIELLKSGSNWVPAPTRRTNPMAYPIIDQPGQTLAESHLAALESLRETATPLQRAWAVFIRLLPWLIPWLAICFGILYIADDPLMPLLVFAGLTAATVYGLNKQDYQHSAAGVEMHKADLAHDLQLSKQADDRVLREKVLDSYIRQMERNP